MAAFRRISVVPHHGAAFPMGREYAVPDQLWDEVADHFNESELSAIILTIATTNFFNRINATIKEPAGQTWS